MFKSPGNPGNNEKTLNYWKFWKFYMLKILKDWFNTFEKSIQKWKFSLFLTIPTNFKDPNENIFNFPTYSRPSRTRWCLFHKNQSQKNFEKNHWISPRLMITLYIIHIDDSSWVWPKLYGNSYQAFRLHNAVNRINVNRMLQ